MFEYHFSSFHILVDVGLASSLPGVISVDLSGREPALGDAVCVSEAKPPQRVGEVEEDEILAPLCEQVSPKT